jgi:hypothetical protein
VPASAAAWLRRDLELAPKGARVLLFVHSPDDHTDLTGVFKDFRITQVFCGHTHEEGLFSVAGVRALQSGSLSQMFSGSADRKVGYSLVLVERDRIEHIYKTLGQPHAVMLESPRHGQALAAKALLKGSFLDPTGEVDALTIQVGVGPQVTANVPFRRTPPCCRFEAELDLSAVPAGFRRIEVALSRGGQVVGREAGSYLVLSGRPGEFTATGDAELALQLAGIDTLAGLVVNGAPMEPLQPTKLRGDGPFPLPIRDADRVTVKLPKERLRRLNIIELLATPRPGGPPDAFCVLDAALRYGGKEYRDSRLPALSRRPELVGTKTVRYVDLLPD